MRLWSAAAAAAAAEDVDAGCRPGSTTRSSGWERGFLFLLGWL
jgi:hypothetical protein